MEALSESAGLKYCKQKFRFQYLMLKVVSIISLNILLFRYACVGFHRNLEVTERLARNTGVQNTCLSVSAPLAASLPALSMLLLLYILVYFSFYTFVLALLCSALISF